MRGGLKAAPHRSIFFPEAEDELFDEGTRKSGDRAAAVGHFGKRHRLFLLFRYLRLGVQPAEEGIAGIEELLRLLVPGVGVCF